MSYFINTRPLERGKPLTGYLRQHGIKVLDLPLLALEPCVITNSEKQYLQQLLTTDYQLVVLVSEHAAQYGLQQLYQQFLLLSNTQQIHAKNKLSQQHWLAVGQKTANDFKQKFKQYFCILPNNVHFPSNFHQQNNEGMINSTIVQNLKQRQKVQIWRGFGGRETLIEYLQQREIVVDVINFYQRFLPSRSRKIFYQHMADFDRYQPIWVLISSVTAWQHWQILLQSYHGNLNHFGYLGLQARICAEIQKKSNKIYQINHLNPNMIADVLQHGYLDEQA